MTYSLENVPGRFYVNSSCVNCSLCVSTAPNNFRRGDKSVYVFKQPVDKIELESCLEALVMCPTSSIIDREST